MATMYEVELESLSPLLHHGSQELGMGEQQMKKKGGDALRGDPEEWRKTVYFDEKIGAYIPASNIEAAMIESAKQFKITGRATATKFFKSGVFIMEDLLPMFVNGKQVMDINSIDVDKRTAKNPATGMRNTRYRAIFRQWAIKFRILVSSDDYIKQDLLKQTIEYAGMYVGLCDYRPRFGRFSLKSIKQVS